MWTVSTHVGDDDDAAEQAVRAKETEEEGLHDGERIRLDGERD